MQLKEAHLNLIISLLAGRVTELEDRADTLANRNAILRKERNKAQDAYTRGLMGLLHVDTDTCDGPTSLCNHSAEEN